MNGGRCSGSLCQQSYAHKQNTWNTAQNNAALELTSISCASDGLASLGMGGRSWSSVTARMNGLKSSYFEKSTPRVHISHKINPNLHDSNEYMSVMWRNLIRMTLFFEKRKNKFKITRKHLFFLWIVFASSIYFISLF